MSTNEQPLPSPTQSDPDSREDVAAPNRAQVDQKAEDRKRLAADPRFAAWQAGAP